ncbi:hypothetical protein ACFKHW_37680 [Bradyrhizobium lupini]|uniref:hypothetical protein n=1 Tax=Rhizobium lupini TaxID=136996 RepID=UPI00367321DE
MQNRIVLFASLVVFIGTGQPSVAQAVKFKNPNASSLELHVRNGPIGQPAEARGSKNTTMKAGDAWDDDVGPGDTWFAYGNQQVNNTDNPPLCNAKGGETVNLDKSHKCFVDN